MSDKALVIGAGKSGINAAKLLMAHGYEVAVFDGNVSADKSKIQESIGNVEVFLGDMSEEVIATFDMAVVSPGVPLDNPIVKKINDANVKLIGEIELGYIYEKGSVVAITGTNGKTTTTTLVGDIIKRWKSNTIVAGNIGFPYTNEVIKSENDSISIIEISSFQLETIDTFHAKVAAILNITPDHLDRHKTMEAYAEAKFNVTKNQTADDFVILNFDDERLREFAKRCTSHVLWFGRVNKPDAGYYYKDRVIYRIYEDREEEILNVDDINLIGDHNYENVMAALAIAEAAGVPSDITIDVTKNFHAVEHRIEKVDTIDGVVYYNDSKGTNTDASIKAIKAMSRPTLLIAGGYDKNSPYDDFIENFDGKIKELVLIGATAEKIKACALEHGFTNIKMADSLEEAVSICKADSENGDAVLLSPACASWDMFKSYEQRGRLFKDLVKG